MWRRGALAALLCAVSGYCAWKYLIRNNSSSSASDPASKSPLKSNHHPPHAHDLNHEEGNLAEDEVDVLTF